MKYIPRPGVVCTLLGGQRVLIPTRQAYEACKSILVLTMPAFTVWNGIAKGNSMEQIREAYGLFSKLEQAEQIKRIESFCQSFLEQGFIMEAAKESSERKEDCND